MHLFPLLDKNIVLSLNHAISQNAVLGFLVTKLAVYGVYLLCLLWVILWFRTGRRQRETLLSSMLAGLVGWQIINRIAKLFYFHERPLHTLPVKELLFQRPENSFPSDHAAFLFGIAFFFFLKKQSKNGWWLFIYALLISLARIAIAVHYPSDILMGIVDGFIAAWLIYMIDAWLIKTVWNWALSLARKLHLA